MSVTCTDGTVYPPVPKQCHTTQPRPPTATTGTDTDTPMIVGAGLGAVGVALILAAIFRRRHG